MVGVQNPELTGRQLAGRPLCPPMSVRPPRFLIIGAGSRGQCYANAIDSVSNGIVAAVAEPISSKRDTLGRRHIWRGQSTPSEGQSFAHWRDFVEYEHDRRRRAVEAAAKPADDGIVPDGVDGAFVCVLDDMHRDVVVALASLGLHIMCEKPLATSLDGCLDMYAALKPWQTTRIFSVGHVLRYSPHNLLLRKLLLQDRVIGEINSVVHTEPVGWWHYTHSYVRGNWRNEETSAPSLLTKSCHDIDLILWLLCSPTEAGKGEPHLPETVSSTGGLQYFKRSRKPAKAGAITNCLHCPLGDAGCKYSAKNIYLGDRIGLGRGNTKWPIDVVVHDIENYGTHDERRTAMLEALKDDWDESTPRELVRARNWFGRCVFESDNNVCDEQFVTIAWPEATRPAKRATFHMTAQTKRQCERFSRFYGENGEIYADSRTIVVDDFATGETRTFEPAVEDLGHGGGDLGLTRQFVLACDKVKSHGWEARRAQHEFVGCTLDEVIRSHVLVFAAEHARLNNEVVNWQQFWDERVTQAV